MKTVEEIIKRNWFTVEELKDCFKKWICNWIWGKGWINFDKVISWLPYFDTKKWEKLHNDLDLISCIHDYEYFKWWNVLDFLKANFKLSMNVIELLHWTKWYSRLWIFILVFWWTTMFWFKYFNWK